MMRNSILITINDRTDYLTTLEAVTGDKTEFSTEEAGTLLNIYRKDAAQRLGFTDETLVKAVLALDVPGVNLLDSHDADALADLCELCADWRTKPEKAAAVKDAALTGNVSAPLTLAMARAALDAYAGQSDIAHYRDEIKDLADRLRQADEEAFSDASAFLIRVREYVRTK